MPYHWIALNPIRAAGFPPTHSRSAWISGRCTAVLLMLCALLFGCFEEEMMSVSLVGYNHTDRSIYSFSVDKTGGPSLWRHSGGGNFTCCITIPEKYRPGMTVTVAKSDFNGENRMEWVVPVPPYKGEDGGRFKVHFLRDGSVKVFVTRYALWHPDYPLKGPEAEL